MNVTTTFEWVFWLSAGALVYSYAVYPLLAFVLAALRQAWRDTRFLLARGDRRRVPRDEFEPQVALLVAAYNEESVIEQKIVNTLALEYPAERFEFLLGLDAPSDSTAERATRMAHGSFRLMPFTNRRGKLAVIRELAAATSAEILVFSDANTMLEPETLRQLVRHFRDPQVGAVCGELRLVNADGMPQGESLYWRYEVALKFLENRLNCVLGANGAVYAVRRELFRTERPWIVEDFQVPMEIRYAGHRVVYDPEATALEESAPSLGAEFRRKVRIGAGAFQTFFGNLHFLNPLKGMFALAYFSHKVLRWFGPFFMLAAWVASGVLSPLHPVYVVAFATQTAFYVLAVAGLIFGRKGRSSRLLALPLYFCAVNLALLLGFFRLLSGRQETKWAATPRGVAGTAVAKGNALE
jgi:cellulose synthase/poly-beta-1,6-N-acetylglucosamine synthase-like glycosyltransferase